MIRTTRSTISLLLGVLLLTSIAYGQNIKDPKAKEKVLAAARVALYNTKALRDSGFTCRAYATSLDRHYDSIRHLMSLFDTMPIRPYYTIRVQDLPADVGMIGYDTPAGPGIDPWTPSEPIMIEQLLGTLFAVWLDPANGTLPKPEDEYSVRRNRDGFTVVFEHGYATITTKLTRDYRILSTIRKQPESRADLETLGTIRPGFTQLDHGLRLDSLRMEASIGDIRTFFAMYFQYDTIHGHMLPVSMRVAGNHIYSVAKFGNDHLAVDDTLTFTDYTIGSR